ncbi:unnamed protein product [Parascedosporium putredinis]|uniref:Uncharacterized protein n=1 Tax=Parascedosporium putredinis TaxID=1442378 RepID=A0A9P1GZB7_9PEZI|nr:unnamed protein product [Parascedosporium putredinis]CAI7991538.1 unnamed protein product [Parascedosporium putredinis]
MHAHPQKTVNILTFTAIASVAPSVDSWGRVLEHICPAHEGPAGAGPTGGASGNRIVYVDPLEGPLGGSLRSGKGTPATGTGATDTEATGTGETAATDATSPTEGATTEPATMSTESTASSSTQSLSSPEPSPLIGQCQNLLNGDFEQGMEYWTVELGDNVDESELVTTDDYHYYELRAAWAKVEIFHRAFGEGSNTFRISVECPEAAEADVGTFRIRTLSSNSTPVG